MKTLLRSMKSREFLKSMRVNWFGPAATRISINTENVTGSSRGTSNNVMVSNSSIAVSGASSEAASVTVPTEDESLMFALGDQLPAPEADPLKRI